MIQAVESGTLSLKYVDLKNKNLQVSFRGTGNLTVEHCTFTEFDLIMDYSTVYGVAIEIYRETAPTTIGTVIISNNTITCRQQPVGGTPWPAGWGVWMGYVYPASATISNNMIDTCYVGFYTYSAPGASVTGNTFTSNQYGIAAFDGNVGVHGNVMVGNNTFARNNIGIYLSASIAATVTNNQIASSQTAGLYCLGGANVTMQNNTITGSQYAVGIFVVGPETDGRVYSNTVSSLHTGISVGGSATAAIGKNLGNSTGGNTIQNCAYYGIDVRSDALNVAIRHNRILCEGPSQVGLNIWTGLSALEYNTIRGNVPTQSGIGLYVNSSNSSFTRNTISYWSVAVYYEEGTNGWNGFNYNNLESSYSYVTNYGSSVIQASNNWWGTTDANAITSKLDGSVNYQPFLTSRVLDAGPYGSWQASSWSPPSRRNRNRAA